MSSTKQETSCSYRLYTLDALYFIYPFFHLSPFILHSGWVGTQRSGPAVLGWRWAGRGSTTSHGGRQTTSFTHTPAPFRVINWAKCVCSVGGSWRKLTQTHNAQSPRHLGGRRPRDPLWGHGANRCTRCTIHYFAFCHHANVALQK